MISGRAKTLTIITPEGVVFPLVLAGPVTRFLAWLIDLLCIMALITFTSQVVSVFQLINPDISNAVNALLYFFISFSYAIIMEWFWKGRTIGKRIFHLRVMDIQGLQLKFSQIVIRNLMRAVDGLPLFYMVGGITSLVSSKAQRFGDIAANTVVIRSLKVIQPELEHILSGKFNSLKAYPHLCARLRQKVSPDLADILVQALLSRNSLEPEARITVFQKTANHVKGIVTFPQQSTEGLSDEQYIKNVVEILFNTDDK